MSKLCKPVSDAERRTPIIKFRVSAAEKLDIEKQAKIRNLTVSDYVRRAVFHRRADVRIETEMILEIRAAGAEIKALHATYKASGNPPPENLSAPVLQNAILAIQSLGRY